MRMHFSVGFAASLALGCLLFVGCSSEPSEEEQNENAQEVNNLDAIYRAYTAATDTSGKPPQSEADLQKYFPEDVDQSNVFKSNRDGQPYVIIWGTDCRSATGTEPLVFGYEKNGKDGQRMVLTVFGTIQMSDEEFRKANFPAGHKP